MPPAGGIGNPGVPAKDTVGTPQEAAAGRPTVWIVDDSPLDAQRAAKVLADRWSVRIFTDGSAVLEHLGTHPPPNVLVVDWVMPGITGIEVIQFLRSEKDRPQVPVLLLTVNGEPEQIAQGLSAGANDFVAKPFSSQELVARVDALLRSAELLERALAAEKSLHGLLIHAPDVSLAVDAGGRVTFANSEAGQLFDCDPSTLIGKPIAELMPELPSRNISVGPGEALVPLPDVQVGARTFSPSIRVLPTDTAATTTIALRDVTERRRADARRLDFYSIIAHDLRSPLSAMMIRTDLIINGSRGPVSPEVVRDIRQQQLSMRSMITIINDFLDLARLEGSGHKIDREELDLCQLIDTTVDELRPLADSGGLNLRWIAPADQLRVSGDRSRLGQVLSNLIGNAIKFTPLGGRIVVTAEPTQDAIEVAISDTGPGIASELVPRLFDRFTRAVNGPQQTVGSGLGLMIVREIIEAHEGHVGVRTELGKGSTFWFCLPVRRVA